MASSSGPTQSISGLVSGLDTNSIINQLMTIERQPQVKIQQQITVEQARQQALKDVLTRVQNLADSYTALSDPSTWADTQTVDSSDTSIIGATRTSGAAAGAYELEVTQLARANQFTAAGGTTTNGVTTANGDDVIHIQIAGQPTPTDVSITAGDTLDTIATKINGTSNTPVYASVVNGALVLSDRATGTAAKIASVTTDGGSGLTFSETQAALDANFTIDGNPFTRSSNIVTDALAGVTLTLKTKTAVASPVTVTIGTPAPDTGGIQQKVQDLVSQYNSTLSFIQGKLTEQTSKTDPTAGVLHGDSGLEDLLTSLRESFSDPVSGAASDLSTLAQVGISTGATTGSGTLNQDSIDGQLTFVTDTFATELSARFTDVKTLFTKQGTDYASNGLTQRLTGLLGAWTATSTENGILNSRIDGETSTISDLQSQSADWDQRLTLKQQQLQAQFTAMETSLSQVQAQGQWLAGQIAKL